MVIGALGFGNTNVVLHPKRFSSHFLCMACSIYPFTYLLIYTSLLFYTYIVILPFCYFGTVTLITKNQSIIEIELVSRF